MKEFERESRYIVAKTKDIRAALSPGEISNLARLLGKVDAHHFSRKDCFLKCVVVEHDWPEYEPTWEAIQKRVETQHD